MKNLNVDFLLDLWADLKARRLAPAAIGMVVVVVAIPALMLKGEEGATEGPLPILASQADQGPEVELAEDFAKGGSKLDSYASRDPFKGKVAPGEGNGLSGAAIAPGDSGGDSGSDAGSSGAKSLADLMDGGSGKAIGLSGPSGGGTGGSSSPSPAPAPTPPLEVVKPRNHRYTYQLDLKFGRPGREKRYEGVTRLSFLPSPSVPALLFMGVPTDEKSALFFVHPGLTHQGEGDCVPSRKNCSFLQLGIGKQHYLSANDLEFRIELLKIHRVKLTDEEKQRATARKSVSGRRSSRSFADGITPGSDDPADKELEFPLLVDGGIG